MSDSVIVKSPEGEFGSVPKQDLDQALAAGATVASQAELDNYWEQKDHPIRSAAETIGYNLVQGAGADLAAPAYIKGAGLIGPEYEKAAREQIQHAERVSKESPRLAAVAKTLGFALPLVLAPEAVAAKGVEAGAVGAEAAAGLGAKAAGMGAAEAGALGAEAAGLGAAEAGAIGASEAAAATAAAAPVAEQAAAKTIAQRVIGGIPGLYSEAGEAVGKRVGGLIGTESALGRVAGKTLGTAAQFATEGALFGAGAALSEDVIENKDVTAEHLLTAAGHGAFWNGVIGAGIGGLGGVAAEAKGIAGKLMPKNMGEFLEKKQSEATFEGITGGAENIKKDAEKYFDGGARGLVDEWEKKSPEWFDSSFAQAAKKGDETLVAGAENGMKKAWSGQESVLKKASAKILNDPEAMAELDPRKWVQEVRNLAEEARRQDGVFMLEGEKGGPGLGSATREIDTFADEMEYAFGLADKNKQPIPLRTESIQLKPGAPAETGTPLIDAILAGRKEVAPLTDLPTLNYFRQRADHVWQTQGGKDVRWDMFHSLRDRLEKAIEGQVEKSLGKEGLSEYKGYKREYQAARYLKDGIEGRRAAGGLYTQAASHLSGAMGASVGQALGGGFVGGAIGYGVGKALAETYKTKAPFVAAGVIRTIRNLAAVEHVEAKVGESIQKGIARYIAGAARLEGVEYMGKKETHATEEDVRRIQELASTPDVAQARIATASGDLGQHAPQLTQAVSSAAMKDIQFLASVAPKGTGALTGMFARKRPLTAYDLNKFDQAYRGVFEPMSAIKDMHDNTLTRIKVDAMAQRRPDALMMMRNSVIDYMIKERLKDEKALKKKLTRKKKQQLTILMGAPIDDTMTPEFIRSMQSLNDNKPNQKGGNQPERQGGGRRPIKIDIESYQTSSQQIESEEG